LFRIDLPERGHRGRYVAKKSRVFGKGTTMQKRGDRLVLDRTASGCIPGLQAMELVVIQSV